MLKVGIIGLGTISSVHRNAINKSENAELVAVCDIKKEKKEDYAGVNFYTDIDQMLDSEKLDCIHVCLPHYLHVPTIIKCAKAGINVFTEKPLGLTYEECTSLFELEKECGVKIGVCLQNRYNATTLKIKEILEEKILGEFLGTKGIVTWCRTDEYYKESPWRGDFKYSGGGVMINQSIHTLDLLSYIYGDFENVNAKISNFSLKPYDIEDSVMARLKYKGSDKFAFFFATISYCDNSSVEIELCFEKGKLKMMDNKLYECSNEEVVLLTEDQSLTGFKDYYGASHIIAIETFYKALKDNTNEYISVQKAAYSIKLINSIVKSSDLNKEIEI